MSLDLHQFAAQLERFRTLVAYNSGGRPFVSFQEGLPAAWESYKPRVRDQALRALDLPSWSEARIGSGKILEACIEAIELHENNLVFWQNRYGH
jgi:hypothetical protein